MVYLPLSVHTRNPDPKTRAQPHHSPLRLKDGMDNRLSNLHGSLFGLLTLQLRNTSPPLVGINVWSGDHVHLSLTHASVDVNVFDGNVERAFLWTGEPGVGLPSNVQDDEEGTGEVCLEEGGWVEVA